jgi:DNA repair protein RecN (Recombination protein N)
MDGERRKDILLYEINEIEEANLRQNEEEELDQERTILANGERIINTINLVYQDIYSGSNIQSSVTDLLGKASSELERIADLDPVLGQLNERIEALLFQLEDIVFDIRSYKEQFEYDPHKLDQIENRLAIIRRLKRKYGTSIQDIFSYLEVIKDELLLLENSQELLEELMKKEKKLFFDLLESCRVLTNQRKKVAKFFEQQLLEQLGELGMDKSSFVVNIDSAEDVDLELSYLIGKITPKGYDDIEFMISTNPGEPVKPLSRIISGGEMSRVMLAFKTILAQLDDIPTLIFDEIDAGISGRIAHVVGEKMGSISRSRQVICVTHLPQIAAMADSHYKIEKIFMDGHTRTTVCKLDYMQRQEEIAKMTGGKTLSKASLEHSSELIRIAKEYKNGLG